MKTLVPSCELYP
jgi:hypothetical protein